MGTDIKTNKQRIKGKHIKHNPNTEQLSKVSNETTFLVKSSTPFVSALKKIQKILDKFDKSISRSKKYQGGEYKKIKYITVKGMGKCIDKTISLGLHFQEEKQHKVDILTGSIQVLDEFILENSEEESDDNAEYSSNQIYKKRNVSYVEIRIWLDGA
ncbi:Piso0_000156 [Millerozyma farinosa CBS 7064]|uniref:Piso0_000156 protein n=1 Tax=Pichia sorbitophila (strain ATCC MYA-4447 / BCRC 22081 / CBS 7064 / NBRC 10061 / NRRL Y-12695) TaxID=559304 RepID=G8YUN9_PICSO|nr:Piso0_000156 [Millerozyma farinosa CBS 7064]